jgi:hypothetical protein
MKKKTKQKRVTNLSIVNFYDYFKRGSHFFNLSINYCLLLG